MGPARPRDLRDANLATVLARVAAAGAADGGGPAPSRAGLAAATGMSRATVSALVDALLAGGLLEEVPPPPPTGAGRPAHGLRLSGARVAALGVEVGVRHLAACARDLTGAVRAREHVPAPPRGTSPADVVAASAALAARVLERARVQGLDVVGAAWALPGLVDADRGRVRLAPNLGWRDVDVLALLAARPELDGLPVALDNEATLAALAELWHPERGEPAEAGRAGEPPVASPSFLLVTGEVGVGAGVVLGGRLLRGERGWSGELGHVAVDPSGPACGCGATGCLEVFAGEEAVLAAAGADGLEALAAAAAAGRPAALAALARAGAALGVAAAGAVNLLDVDAVVLGGAYAPLAPWLVPHVREQLARRVLRARLVEVPVRASATGADAAVVGAAALVLQGVLDDPASALAR